MLLRRGGRRWPSCCCPSRAAPRRRPPGGALSWAHQARTAAAKSCTGGLTAPCASNLEHALRCWWERPLHACLVSKPSGESLCTLQASAGRRSHADQSAAHPAPARPHGPQSPSAEGVLLSQALPALHACRALPALGLYRRSPVLALPLHSEGAISSAFPSRQRWR